MRTTLCETEVDRSIFSTKALNANGTCTWSGLIGGYKNDRSWPGMEEVDIGEVVGDAVNGVDRGENQNQATSDASHVSSSAGHISNRDAL